MSSLSRTSIHSQNSLPNGVGLLVGGVVGGIDGAAVGTEEGV